MRTPDSIKSREREIRDFISSGHIVAITLRDDPKTPFYVKFKRILDDPKHGKVVTVRTGQTYRLSDIEIDRVLWTD